MRVHPVRGALLAAARHPERLGNVVDLTDRYAHLADGVEIDE